MKKRPLIAVPFAGAVSPSAIVLARKGGMDVAELRVDLFASVEKNSVLAEIRKFKKIPTILTIRSKKEGGAWKSSEARRLELFKAALPSVSKVDIELSSRVILKDVIRETKRLKKEVIVSYHNFDKTPSLPFLEKILKEAKSAGADVVKIAAMAHSPKDVRRLAEFTYSHARQGLITLSMGKEGAFSRILFPSLGSRLTFAHTGRSTAPGQWDLKTTAFFFKKLYR